MTHGRAIRPRARPTLAGLAWPTTGVWLGLIDLELYWESRRPRVSGPRCRVPSISAACDSTKKTDLEGNICDGQGVCTVLAPLAKMEAGVAASLAVTVSATQGLQPGHGVDRPMAKLKGSHPPTDTDRERTWAGFGPA